MAVTLLHEMARRGTRLGAVTLCGGGGQGEALLLSGPDGGKNLAAKGVVSHAVGGAEAALPFCAGRRASR